MSRYGAASGAVAGALHRAREAPARPDVASALSRVLEPEARGPRIAVALAVVLLSGLAGYGAVSALETPREAGDDSGVVTATPVGPLPPGVGPTAP